MTKLSAWSMVILALVLTTTTTAQRFKETWGEGEVPGCFTKYGFIALGRDKLIKEVVSRCTILTCKKEGLDSEDIVCSVPRCVKPVLKDMACCLSCPDGENCWLPNGDILPAGEELIDGNQTCYCPKVASQSGWNDNVTNAVCDPITTPPPTTTPYIPPCSLPEGGNLQPGEMKIVPKDDNCRKYVCSRTGHLNTSYGECSAAKCNKPVRHPGACCKTCPDDPDAASDPISYVTSPAPARNVTYVRVDFNTFLHILLQHVFGFHLIGNDKHHHSHHHKHHSQHHHHQQGSNTKGHDHDQQGKSGKSITGESIGAQPSKNSWSPSWNKPSHQNHGHGRRVHDYKGRRGTHAIWLFG